MTVLLLAAETPPLSESQYGTEGPSNCSAAKRTVVLAVLTHPRISRCRSLMIASSSIVGRISTMTAEAVRRGTARLWPPLAVLAALGLGLGGACPAVSLAAPVAQSARSAAGPIAPPEAVPEAIRPPTAAESEESDRLLAQALAAASAKDWSGYFQALDGIGAIEDRTYGPQHPETLRTLSALGRAWQESGRAADGVVALRRRLQADEQRYGADSPRVAVDLTQLAKVVSLTQTEDKKYKHEEAEGLLLRAQAIWSRQPVPRAEEADTLAALGYAMLSQERYRTSEDAYRRALDITERTYGPASQQTAGRLAELGFALSVMNDYRKAEAIYRRSLTLAEQLHGPDSLSAATVLNELASALKEQGRQAEAEPLLRRAVAIQVKSRGPNSLQAGWAYRNLANFLQAQGFHDEALDLHRRALAIAEKHYAEDDIRLGYFVTNLAGALDCDEPGSEAEQLLRRRLEIDRKRVGDDDALGMAAFPLAQCLNREGLAAEAAGLFDLVLRMEAKSAPSAYNAMLLTAAATNRFSLGRYAESEALDRKALAIRIQVFGEDSRDAGRSYAEVATDLHALGRAGEAENLAARAVLIARRMRDLDAGAGETGEAGALLRARASNGDRPEPMRYTYRKYIPVAYDAAAADPARAAELQGRAFTAAQDFTASAEGAAMALAAARAAAGTARLGQAARRQQDLSGQVRALDQQQLAALGRGDAAREAAIREQRGKVLVELAGLDAEIARDFPGYAQLARPPAVEIAALQQRLGAGEGLVMILPVGEDMFSFAVAKTRVAWNKLADGAAPTAERVATLRAAMGGAVGRRAAEGALDDDAKAKVGRFDRLAAYQLYADLIAPVESALPGVTRLYSVVSGPLSDLPLSVLLTNAPRPGSDDSDEALADPDTPFLSERYALATLPSVSSLGTRGREADLGGAKATPVSSAKPEPFIGYGAPSLVGSAAGAVDNPVAGFQDGKPFASRAWVARFSPLPGTRRELDQMAATLKASPDALQFGSKARESLLRQDPRLASAQVVAFATHGFTAAQAKGLGEPGLILTPPENPSAEDDGVLTASEAAALSFSADWVILSACDTASPDGAGGQSLSALARGFLYAGAGGLLASHWPVDDAVTAVLTTETLRLRASGLTRGQALQGAMRAIRTGQRSDGSTLPGWNPHWANPRLWAPFSVITHQDR